MSSSDFRQITHKTDARRAERLFRAAVSAFCSLTRPSRREIVQLEDLALPLFESVSVESRRYVAAALSECPTPPTALVRRLCDEPVDVAAPLLIRSSALSDVDLIALIGRHGYPHARAIARRRGLNPIIAGLVAALDRRANAAAAPEAAVASTVTPSPEPETAVPEALNADAAETTRQALRTMMAPSSDRDAPTPAAVPFETLRDAALTGNPALLQTALADALGVDFAATAGMVSASGYAWLLAGLRALDLREEQAFLITAAAFPAEISNAEAVRLFLMRFRLLHPDVALDRIRAWQARAAEAASAPAAPRPLRRSS